MKGNQRQIVLAGVLLAAGGMAYLFGFVRYDFLLGSVKVALYPAAFLVLVGIVQVWRALMPTPQKS